MADPYFNSVSMLVGNDNAANGSGTFVDQSSFARTISKVGAPTYTNSTAPSGMTTVIDLTNTSNYLTVAGAAALSFPGDVTVECMVNFQATYPKVAYAANATANSNLYSWASNGRLNFYDGTNRNLGVSTFSTGVWRHFAWVRSGTTLTGYVDGVAESTPYTTSSDLGSSTGTHFIGNDAFGGGDHLRAFICCLRVTKGVARYTANFTPPSLPFPTTAVDPPVADFTGVPTSGAAPLSVAFTDSSTNTPTSWLWEKNSGSGWVNFSGTPTVQNPTESFTAGTWSVRLTATNAAGSDTKTRTNYITPSAAATTRDTHDGAKPKRKPWYQRLEFVKEETDERARSYRSNREQLRRDILFAMDGPIEAETLDIIREHMEPAEMERLSAPDYEPELRGLLSQTEALRHLAALVLSEQKRQDDEDEEDIEMLLLH